MTSSEPIISTHDLRKSFKRRRAMPGFWAHCRSFVQPEYDVFEAVQGITLSVYPGERVAFLGPNGAGKSTTIKMLTGILYPSSGTISVGGLNPWEQRRALAHTIGVVFGQRSQLWYHLPPMDTYRVLARMYDLKRSVFTERFERLCDLFELADFVDTPVRRLSLGQRMRCEIVASLLHQPKALFLDEPTIGLDVTAKAKMRDFIRAESEREGTTIFLTSHDVGDIEQVCERVVLIDRGQVLLDQSVADLKRTYLRRKRITIVADEERVALTLEGVSCVSSQPHQGVFDIDVAVAPMQAVMDAAVNAYSLRDLTVEDTPLEEIIRLLYDGGGVLAHG